jgi:hypothetical protein
LKEGDESERDIIRSVREGKESSESERDIIRSVREV